MDSEKMETENTSNCKQLLKSNKQGGNSRKKSKEVKSKLRIQRKWKLKTLQNYKQLVKSNK